MENTVKEDLIEIMTICLKGIKDAFIPSSPLAEFYEETFFRCSEFLKNSLTNEKNRP
jgi:hypothetical protein